MWSYFMHTDISGKIQNGAVINAVNEICDGILNIVAIVVVKAIIGSYC